MKRNNGAHTSPDQPWRDRKRYLWPLGVAAAAGPFLAWGLVHFLSWKPLWGFGWMLFVLLIPLADALAGRDKTNPPREVVVRLEHDRYYRWCTYAYLPLQYAGFFFAFWCVSAIPMEFGEKAGMMATVAIAGAVGINVAHELGHKKPEHERTLARIALAQTCYGHFYTEHNRGHHVRAATPEDPASARLGESLWAFLPRAVAGGLRSGVRLEAGRLRRQGKRFVSPANDILQSWLLSLVLAAIVVAAFGWAMLPWFVAQAVLGALILESVNYIEHYGLLRPVGANGRPVRVQPEHSWNSDHLCSNLFLFHLQRHSDHHANPRKRYQTLCSIESAPQLPAGYGALVMVAAFPPLWRRVMDKRVLAHYGGDVTRANIQPSKRARVLASYGAADH